MLRTIFSPRWLLAIVVAAVFAVACVFLGRWQWGKYVDKQLRADTIATNYGAAPVPFAGVAGRLPLPETGEWMRVTVQGTYDDSKQLLVRNRVQDGSPGLEVLVPLIVTTQPPGSSAGAAAPAGAAGSTSEPGQRLLVDRGWVQNADTAAQLPSVPPAPGGTVTVQGWLRRPEPSLGRDLPRGQLASMSVSDAEGQLGGTLLPVYLVLQSERTGAGLTPARPAPLALPDTDLGPNQAYAFQWWLFSAFGFVFYGYRLKVTREEQLHSAGMVAAGAGREPAAQATRAGSDVGDARDPGGAEDATSRQLVPAGGQGRRARPKKVRIWDEEDS